MVNRPIRIFAGALLVLGLPLAARVWRSDKPDRCALDGAAIAPEYRIRLVESDGVQREFCGVACLSNWLTHSPKFSELFLTDETTRREIPAAQAWLVRSSVVTQRATGNRIHCFADHDDALRHAREARGKLLKSGEQPWATTVAAQAGDGA